MNQVQGRPKNGSKLSPREHGAYGQLLAPLSAALFGGRITGVGVCFALSAISAFFAHEPWLVLSGQRGSRAERNLAAAAKRRLAALLVLAALLGSCGLVLAEQPTRLAALLVAVLALSAVLLSHKKQLHSAIGEVWAGATLAFLGIPVALASGVSWALASANALAWACAFASGVFAVRAVIHRQKTGSRGNGLWGIVAVLILLGIMAANWLLPVLAVLPLALGSAVVFIVSPSPKSLRPIGWTLVGLTLLAAIVMISNTRRSPLVQRDLAASVIRD